MDSWNIWLTVASLASLALFTTLNIALRSPSRARIAKELEELGGPSVVRSFVARRQQYTLATAILRSVSVVTLILSVLHYALNSETGVSGSRLLVASLAAWILLLVFGVAIPDAWAKYSGEWLTVRCRWVLAFLRLLAFPLLSFLQIFDPLVRRLAGVPIEDAQSYADKIEEEILNVVTEGELHGAVDSEEKQMIESVIEMGEQRVAEIMTPRTDIMAVKVDDTYETILGLIRKHGHSRIPVYENTIDTVLGILYIKDLLRRGDESNFQVRSVMRKALFIPESKPVRELLREFQKRKLHIAVVLDEYGGTAGLVTIEDILEEVVGELADEYEVAEPEPIKQINEQTFEVDARVRIDELNERLQIEVPEHADYETIGGFVFSTLGKIPKVGETFQRDAFSLQVIGAEPRRVTRVLLTITSPNETRNGNGDSQR